MSINYVKLLLMIIPNTFFQVPFRVARVSYAALTLEKELANNVNVYLESKISQTEFPLDFCLLCFGKNIPNFNKDIPVLREMRLIGKMIQPSVLIMPYNIRRAGNGIL
uniref:hypothetical protein n=1 Tax=Agaricus bitorquis TaxID=5343 RepID=UPI0027A1F3B7|nr:hypothetical protein QLP03_mgp073 [Agaricus bitorquis]WFG53995.1 hypothetical protein [Agaricus bitorquis]